MSEEQYRRIAERAVGRDSPLYQYAVSAARVLSERPGSFDRDAVIEEAERRRAKVVRATETHRMI